VERHGFAWRPLITYNRLINKDIKAGSLLNGVRFAVLAQLVLVALAAGLFLATSGWGRAGSALFGGVIAIGNLLLLEWRRGRTDRGPALSASRSIRVLYRSALERMGLVVLLFAAGLGLLRLDPLGLLTGFIAGQLGLLLTGIRRKN
jgi:ATP synthase protein I